MTQFQDVRAFHEATGADLDVPFNNNTLPILRLREDILDEEVIETNAEFDQLFSYMQLGKHVPPELKAAFLKELVDVVYVAMGTAAAFGLDFDTAFARVHASNMSKLVDGKALKRDDGKVLKGPNYQPPHLLDLVS